MISGGNAWVRDEIKALCFLKGTKAIAHKSCDAAGFQLGDLGCLIIRVKKV